MIEENSIAILGAGLCGLTLANTLSENSIYIIEKSKAVGGRMATRRDGLATYDHGAQFYTQSKAQDFFWHQRWIEKGISKQWFVRGDRSHFCGTAGMTILAKDLAADRKIFFEEKVLAIDAQTSTLKIKCESGKIFEAKRVILTSPLPQSLEILRASGILYPLELEKVKYAKAIVGLVQLSDADSTDVDFLDFASPGSALFSVANNKSKGISHEHALSIVMNPEWSEQHFNESDEVLVEKIVGEFSRYYPHKFQIQKAQIKKWRYSHPIECYTQDFLPLLNDKLILAGDGFTAGSLNGAQRSALAVTEFLKFPEIVDKK